MSRTGLSPADIADSFRDRCGDGSVEWVYTPMQTWVLLDAADMLDENAKLREYVTELEAANLDVTARLEDYIGQYDPTDAFVAEVKAENEKLLEQKIDAYNDMVIARLDADELQAEIAMLKELVRDMAAEIRGLGVDFKRVGWCDYADRMRELGVDS